MASAMTTRQIYLSNQGRSTEVATCASISTHRLVRMCEQCVDIITWRPLWETIEGVLHQLEVIIRRRYIFSWCSPLPLLSWFRSNNSHLTFLVYWRMISPPNQEVRCSMDVVAMPRATTPLPHAPLRKICEEVMVSLQMIPPNREICRSMEMITKAIWSTTITTPLHLPNQGKSAEVAKAPIG